MISVTSTASHHTRIHADIYPGNFLECFSVETNSRCFLKIFRVIWQYDIILELLYKSTVESTARTTTWDESTVESTARTTTRDESSVESTTSTTTSDDDDSNEGINYDCTTKTYQNGYN